MQAYHTLSIGTIIRDQNQDWFIVEALLGKGGFGAVYLVREWHNTGALFALKEVINTNKHERDRFEGELLKKLEHRALPRVHDAYRVFDDRDDRTYLLMDYIKGANLEVLRLEQPQARIPLSQVLTIMAPIVDAVAYLHKQNPPIIHRDIKPENIIVPAASNEAVLVDFGLAKEYVPDRTTTIIRHGTPGYAAPEQYVGGTDPRTDVYGLGATLYTLLTGVVPIDALQRLTEERGIDPLLPVSQLLPTIPLSVARDIKRAMALSSKDRFSTIEEFWGALYKHATQNEESAPDIVSDEQPMSDEQPVPKASDEQPVPDTLKTQPTFPRSRRPVGFFKMVLALLVLVFVGAGFWIYSEGLRHSTPIRSMASTTIPASTVRLTPTVRSILYPPVARQYVGTIDDIVANAKTDMSLMNIQQSGKNVSGFFTGLGLNGPFIGTIDTSGHIQFQVTIYSGNSTLSFEGTIKLGGDIAGSYEVINQNNQFTGESGIWSITPSATG